MTVNLSSRKVKLIIGSQDWTNWIDTSNGIQIGYPEYEMGKGLAPVTGTITLKYSIYDPSLPSNPSYFANPSQWKRGQLVALKIADSTGTLTYPPCSGSALYLLRPTQLPQADNKGIVSIALSVGCRLALDNFPPEPNRNVAGIPAGVPTNRAVPIRNIFDYINIPHSISSMPYDISYPLPKTDGNWVGFAGKIADSAGYYLKCTTVGTVKEEPISLDITSTVEAYVIGVDEKLWIVNGESSEQPLEKLILTGVNQIVEPVNPHVFEEIAEYAPICQVSTFPAFQTSTGLVGSKLTRTSKRLVSNDVYVVAETIFLPLCQVSSSTSYQSSTGLVASKESRTEYYLKSGVVYRIVESVAEPVCQVSSDDALKEVTALTPSKRTEQLWTKNDDKKTWTKVTATFESICRVSSSPSLKSVTNLTTSAPSFTNPKDTIGPPTGIGETSTNTVREEQLVATVYAVQLAADPYRERQRTIDVPYAVSTNQLSAYGNRYNRLLTGRSLGFQFAGAITDAALSSSFKPFATVTVQHGDLLYYCKLDAIHYAINLTEAYVLWNAIVIATAPTSSPSTVTYPVATPLALFAGEMVTTVSIVVEPLDFGVAELVTTASIANILTIWKASMVTTGSVAIITTPPPSGLVSKTVTYFNCDEANGTRNTSHTDNFRLSYTGSGFVNGVTGVINDGFPPNLFSCTSPTSGLVESTISLNAVSFFGFAFAFRVDTLPSFTEILFGNEQFRLEFDGNDFVLIIVDSGLTEYSVTNGISYGGLPPSNVTDWNMVVCTVDVSAGIIGIQLNNRQIMGSPSIQTASCPTSGFKTYNSDPYFQYSGITIDEMLIFDAQLDATDRDTLWNSGNFDTYPW